MRDSLVEMLRSVTVAPVITASFSSLTSPEIDPEFWAVDARDKDGKIYSGIRLNEDTYTIQLLDLNENLRSLAKADLRNLTIDTKKSRMPTYAGVFTTAELDDLVAYLYSLQKNERGQ